ncbi:hypothetical protein [Hyperthermus butylicus]|uniref:Uncharacterized protein n=1 Tax=Hyperthermus butylicus (strain DSM 5456 / JCM 9403 / PLM1-5) TaxID=415426 RepID=A2BKK9_HYPBU|nr:hypothetical protein [Hyperthermus butylicus]ABM80520.1 hypothetical protein Hbut_0664 [Hyperthermus butylicus DSM 5456]
MSRITRQRLEELRARLVLETGKRYTIQEIVDAAVAIAARMRDELLRELGAWEPLSRDEAEKLLDMYSIDLPVEDVEEDIDKVLYGELTG